MAETKSISQLLTAERQTTSDLFETSIPNGDSYLSRKVSMNEISNMIINSISYGDLTTDDKTVVGAINEKVGFTDYASGSRVGVIKSSTSYGTSVSTNGLLYGYVRTLDQYNSDNDKLMICKGTLENRLAEKEWVLKGTLDTDNKDEGVTVDFTNCMEFTIEGTYTSTANNGLKTNNKTLLPSSSTGLPSGTKGFYIKYQYDGRHSVPTIAKSGSSLGSANGNMNAYVLVNTTVDTITKLTFSDSSIVTDCGIKIYAR